MTIFILLSLAVFLTLIYFKAPLLTHYFLASLLFYTLNAPLNSWLIFSAISAIFLIPTIRRIVVTKLIVKIIKAKKFLPEISETEETALQAGNVWIEEELFSGNPNFKKILSHPYNKLSKAEQDFMDKQVNHVCEISDDWKIYSDRDISKEAWDYLKKEKFFGMIIPKKYGGLGFTALGHSSVVQKLATRSQVLAISVMVPNSLGPAELLMRYGTNKQKDHYLPRLAVGKEIPCFALTEPMAGSDATSIEADGETFKDKDGKIKIKLNFKKRYITLGSVATVIGLAFKIRDPKKLLGKNQPLGITCAFLNGKDKNITIRRHDPLGVPFVNATLIGKDVEIDIDDVIGGADGVGKGWKMLMECLSIGRGISLPATSTGGSKLVSRVVANYTQIRSQFSLPIGKFEGIQEVTSEIAGLTYMLDASRIYTASAIDNGYRPSVANAIMKYHTTEQFRKVINHGMDILGGAAICRGPQNLLAHAYMGSPVAITVEGANIMTRSLLQFGQGAIRCHPHSYHELKALMNDDLKAFDHHLFKHIGHLSTNKIRFLFLYLTRGKLQFTHNKGVAKKYEQKLKWASAAFAYYSDVALALFGGNLKRKEYLSGRFGDILSYLYLASCVLRRYKSENNKLNQDYFIWSMEYCMENIQKAFEELLNNFSSGPLSFIFKFTRYLHIINPMSFGISDKLKSKLATSLLENEKIRNSLTEDVFVSKDSNDILNKMESYVKEAAKLKPAQDKIKKAIRAKKLNKKSSSLLSDAVKAKIISEANKKALQKLEKLAKEIVEVNSFEEKDYLSHKMSNPMI
jgi:acyl-CoA dehydrogenase